jgi:hypothetical protein
VSRRGSWRHAPRAAGRSCATDVVQALAWIAAITVVFFTLTVRQYRRLT